MYPVDKLQLLKFRLHNLLTFNLQKSSKTTPSLVSRFCGYYTHSRSGLDFAMFRAYSPKLGRWMSRDPLGELGGSNLYAYAANQVTRMTDPSGLAYIAYNGPHPQIVFQDPPPPGFIGPAQYSNIGFANGGVFTEDPSATYLATPSGGTYDDTLMRQAVNQVLAEGGFNPAYTAPSNDPLAIIMAPVTMLGATLIGIYNPDNYHLTGNNCQDFVATIIDRYDLLLTDQLTRKKCQE